MPSSFSPNPLAADARLRPALTRLLRFTLEVHPPVMYALVAAGWSASLVTLAAGTIAPWHVGLGLLFFLALLYLRLVDEVKDLPYDRLHHPGRPIPRGIVTPREVSAFAAAVAVATLGCSAVLSARVAMLTAAQLAYAMLLLVMERRSARFREHILFNLAFTFPVSAVLNVQVLAYLRDRGVAIDTGTVMLVLAAHVAVFLHLDFGRKLRWPRHAQPGDNGYASALGAWGAMAACAALIVIACASASTVWILRGAGLAAAVPWLAVLPAVVGLRVFHRDRGADSARPLKPWFGGAMLLFFAANVLGNAWA